MKFLWGLIGCLMGSLAFAQLTVVTSMQAHYDLLRQVAGDKVQLIRLLPLGASPHTFDPSPKDLVSVSKADLVIINGGIDAWLLKLVEASGTKAPVIELLEQLEFDPIYAEDHESEIAETSPEEGKDRDFRGVNSHIWLDPVLMIEAIPILVAALSEVDGVNAQFYQANGLALVASLEELHRDLAEILSPIQGAVFIPFHDAWPYFARRYNLHLLLEIEPAPGREPSPSYIARALEEIKQTGAKAIFSDIQLPARPAEVIAENAGLPLFTLDPEGGSIQGETYQDFMRKNAMTILKALR